MRKKQDEETKKQERKVKEQEIAEARKKEEEEMKLRIQAEAEAKVRYEAEQREKQEAEKESRKLERKNNPKHFSVWSLVLGLVSYPLFLTYILPLFTAALGFVFGVKGLKSTKKAMAVVGLILNVIVYGLYVVAFLS